MFLIGLASVSAEAADGFFPLASPGVTPAYTIFGVSRDGSRILFSNGSGNPYIATLGGVPIAVTLPADNSRINQGVSGLSSGGGYVYGWTTKQIQNGTAPNLFRYDLSGHFQDYAPADALEIVSVVSDASGSAFSGNYKTLVGNTFVRQAYIWRPDSNAFARISGLEGIGSQVNATGISGDGTTVIGDAELGGVQRSFRWTSGGGTQSLGVLGDRSFATLVSRDGSVIAGRYEITSPNGAPNPTTSKAYRWTAASGMQSIGTLGATYGASSSTVTDLKAMNEAGSVLVGSSFLADGDNTVHAFRWSVASGGTMQDLGTPSGATGSVAKDVSEDGLVVVGDYSASGQQGGFYWTQTGGMKTLDAALRDAGVSLPTDMIASAEKVSADGTVITGKTRPNGSNIEDLYFARLSRAASGIVTQDTLIRSLAGASEPQQRLGSSEINLVFNGVGGLPMRNLLAPGTHSFWSTLDSGYTDRGGAEGGFGLGEVGVAAGFDGDVTARLALSGSYANLNLADDGALIQRGYYMAPDLTGAVSDDVYLTVGALFGAGQMDITRGYQNGASLDFSTGSANTASYGAKIRFDWLNAAQIGETTLTPYAALNYAHFSRDAYTETGGAFPASFARSDNDLTVARLGVDAVHPMGEDLRLLLRAEADYRFEDRVDNARGTVAGVGTFTLSGEDLQQFWLRGALGAEFDLASGTASLTLNATTNGAEPNLWLRSSWRKTF